MMAVVMLRALAWAVCLIWWLLALRQLVLLRHIPHLKSFGGDQTGAVSVSILIPARNEAHTLAAALSGILAAVREDPRFEVILVDDHSTDRTGAIADALAVKEPCLHVLHLRAGIPEGWWGKSYACYQAYRVGRGQYLLFSDADTLYRRGALSAVANYAAARQPDHLLVY